MKALQEAYEESPIPDQVDEGRIERLLVSLRKQLYA